MFLHAVRHTRTRSDWRSPALRRDGTVDGLYRAALMSFSWNANHLPSGRQLATLLRTADKKGRLLEDATVAALPDYGFVGIRRQQSGAQLGRRNWLFTWTELGAKHVGIAS